MFDGTAKWHRKRWKLRGQWCRSPRRRPRWCRKISSKSRLSQFVIGSSRFLGLYRLLLISYYLYRIVSSPSLVLKVDAMNWSRCQVGVTSVLQLLDVSLIDESSQCVVDEGWIILEPSGFDHGSDLLVQIAPFHRFPRFHNLYYKCFHHHFALRFQLLMSMPFRELLLQIPVGEINLLILRLIVQV